jgi:multiple sugar transport system permease protein
MTQAPTAGAAQAAEEHTAIAKQRYSEGKKAERQLGLMLCAPAVIIMLAVTAYPILYAFWLSLQRADMRTPDANAFVGLSNYATVLASPIWWRAFGITSFYTFFGVIFELIAAWCAPPPWCRTRSSPWWPRSRGGSPGPRGWATWPDLTGRR